MKVKQQKSTIKEVASLAGVSPAVVSRVINNDSSLLIRDETRNNVLQAVKKLQYKPDFLARGLRTNKSGMIGLMLIDYTNPFAGQLIRGAQDALVQSGMFCMTCETKEEESVSKKWIELLQERRVEGLIIATVKESDPIIDLLEKYNFKYVMATRRAHNSKAPSVLYDTYQGMTLAMEHLIELGHTRIAHITGHLKTTPGELRIKAYSDAHKEHGLTVRQEYVVQANFLANSGGDAMANLLKLKEIPTAVVACNDAVAISAIQSIKEFGLKIPRDISIVGFHNIPYSLYVDPPLTTIDTHTSEIGNRAAGILLDLIQGKEPGFPNQIINVDFINRSSTGPA
jgi:DNA-binding LacI/PurR family transcriptional regulator